MPPLPQLLRLIHNTLPTPVHWRDMRSHLLVDGATATAPNEDGTCELRLTGFIRGRPMNVNRLVHMPNLGTFRLRCIEAAPEPLASRQTSTAPGAVLATMNDDLAEPLVMEADGDTAGNEQSMLTADEFPELEGEDDVCDAAAHVKRFPKGLTDAQKAWFDFDDEEGHVFGMDDADEGLQFSDEELEEVDMRALRKQDEEAQALFVRDDESLQQLREAELRRRREREAEEREFPDEIDTPLDVPARERFARYRALRSFRTSPWHRHESLPPSYARIHTFEDFRMVQRMVLEENEDAERAQLRRLRELKARARARAKAKSGKARAPPPAENGMDAMDAAGDEGGQASALGEDDGTLDVQGQSGVVAMGTYVTLVVGEVPARAAEAALDAFVGKVGTGVPLVISSLLQHENRLSVVHFKVQRAVADGNVGVVHSEVPVQSKDTLRFVCGFRSWKARPVFSEETAHGDKHRFERFFKVGQYVQASCFAPVCYAPQPVLIFKDGKDAQGRISTQLLATGSVETVDPDRLIIKRILLSGWPARVHKRSATIKWMFFNAKDVMWFKPAELHTRSGMTGHIKESLGSHGLFKAKFSKAISQADTVFLPLYKRVFAKFPEEDRVEVF